MPSRRISRSTPASPEAGSAPPLDPPVALVLCAVPELAAHVDRLILAVDGDPGGPAVLTELADFVGARLSTLERERRIVERALGAVEALAAGGDEDLVAYAFLDSLSPEERHLLRPELGPATARLLEALDTGDL